MGEDLKQAANTIAVDYFANTDLVQVCIELTSDRADERAFPRYVQKKNMFASR